MTKDALLADKVALTNKITNEAKNLKQSQAQYTDLSKKLEAECKAKSESEIALRRAQNTISAKSNELEAVRAAKKLDLSAKLKVREDEIAQIRQ